MSRIRSYGPTLVLLFTVLLILAVGPSLVRQMAHAQTDAQIQLVKNNLNGNASLAELSEAFTQVATVVEPSVVHISVATKQQRSRRGGTPDQLRRWFFGQPDNDRETPDEDDGAYDKYDPNRPSGNGSGWVYDADGHIITNHHVIANADEITVRFSDDTERTATVIGQDPNTDIAVIKVDANDLHPAERSFEPVRQGEIVFAFGSPLRFDFSMTQGIVSAQGRRLGLTGRRGYENFIQTDAAINPGNSGGPLTNIYGQVIGMNTAIASRTGTNTGLGFAIPVEMVSHVADSLIKDGKVRRGYLGIFIEDLDADMAETFGYEGKGVLVADPIPGSPSEKAGLIAGDIITHINGDPVGSAEALRMRVARFSPGTKIDVRLFREGETEDVTITLGELPSSARVARAEPTMPENEIDVDTYAETMESLKKFGIEGVESVSSELIEQMGVSEIEGVVITGVRDGSTAASKGIARGLIITRVQRTDTPDVEAFMDAIEDIAPGKPIRLRVARWNPQDESFAQRFVVIELPND